MKIQKVLKRSLLPPPSLMEIIKSFLNVEEGHLYSLVVKTTRDWAYAKTDFFHWIGVLNRFDDLLEKMVKKYELPNQKECLNEVDKATILGIIKITEHLWDNATNRNLYSSYEHLFSLLYLVEMDVVHELMKFLIRPASRLDSQKSLRTPFMNAAPTFQLFADRWPISVLDGLGGKVGFPNSIQTRFYRTAQELKEINDSVISPMDLAEQSKETLPDHSITSLSGTATEPAKTTSISPSESTIPEQSIFKTPKQKKSKVERELKTADSPFSNTSSDNHLHVSINIPTLLDCSDSSILSTLDKVRNLHHLSGRRSLEVLIKIRLGTFINVVEKRHMMLSIRLLALSILCSAYQEDVATEKIFMYEPELIQNLTQALILDTKLPLELRTTILCLLESISRYRTKLTEILGAMNASTNHGHLMILLRKVISANSGAVVSGTTFSLSTDEITLDFCDILFSFLTFILQTQTGGNMLISAGIMPILVSSLNNHEEGQIKVVSKCMSILDDILYAFLPSLEIFRSINGLNALVLRIGVEIDYCSTLSEDFLPDEFLPGNIPDPGVSAKFRKLFSRTPLLRALMKLILHMMQSSGTADGMRNLIDSTLPNSILKVFQNSRLFGAVGIFGLSINVMSTFVHNEPTSLAILQEAKLPSTFLESANDVLPISPEVISALPNAFGAICLNEAGMESFVAMNPVDRFLSVFTREEYLKILLDNDVPHLVGNSIDELIRHHPTLKEMLIKSVVKVVKELVAIGKKIDPCDVEGCTFFVKGKMIISDPVQYIPGTDVKIDQDEDSRLSQFIGIVSGFLEGLFQNASHCKDFVKYGGLEDLLVLYRLDGLPADFAVSGSSACVSYIFRSILEVNPTQTAAAICKEIRSSYQNLAFYFSAEPTKIIEMTDLDVNEEDKVGEAQKIFRYMVSLKCYVRLLNDIYCSGSLSHNKSFVSVVEMFKEIEGVGESPVSVLKLFSNLEEFCTTQKHSLIEKFSLKVCNPIDKKDCIPEGYEELPAKNARLLYPLVDEIPSDFISLMKGILKIVSNRKVTTSQVASCQGIIDQIANILKVNVDRATTSSAVDKQQKWHIALQNLKSMLFEERGPATISMQSFLGYSFYKCNGISTLISLLGNEDFVNSLNSLSSTSELAEPSSAEILLSILQNYVTENLVINSPYTPVLVSRHSRKIASGFFEPSAFLIDLRLLIFPEILKLFFSDNLSKFTPHSIQTIFAIIIFVLKAKGEDDQPPHMRSLANRLVSSIFGTMTTAQPAPLPQPDDTKVEFLFDMGFPRSAARIALSRCGNSVARATDYILSHPEILSEISPTVNAQTTGANVGGGSSIRVEEPLAAPENASEGAATSVLDATMPAQLDEIETSNFHDDNDVAMVSADSSEAREIPFLPLENVETQVDPKEELEKLRVSKKQEIVDRVISFVADMDPTLVFSVKEVIVCIGKKEIDKIVGRLIKSIQHNFAVLASDTESKQIVHSKLALLSHLVALIVTDHSVRKYIISSSELREFDIVALIEKVLGNEKWISPMLIILETQISFNEDPFDEPIQTDPSKFSNEIPVVKFQKPLDDPFCLAVTKIMVSLVSIEGVETDLFHAVLRILVRVTRNYDVAKYFIEIGGYSALLKLGKFAAFPNNEALLILIARNCFESPEVIQKVLERELTRFLSIPRPRTVDVSSMLKSSSHLVLRAPDAFLRAISSVYKLTNYVPSPVARSCIVALKEFAEDVSKNAATSLDLPTNSKSTPQGTPLKASFMGDKFSEGSISPVSGQLVQYLSSQLIASKNQDINSNDLHLRRCFILQIFAELILEYPSCKIDLILSSQKRKQTPKSFGKNLLLSFLLNDIIPVDMVLNTPSTSEPVATEISRKLVESTWASCVIAALCYSSGSKLEEAYKYELDTIKVIVVEAIIRSLKINKSESVPFEVQNGKLVSLADLCFKLLSAKTIVYPGQTKCSGKLESHTLSMARIMISKGLVAVLTLSLAELDIHHPGSQKVVSSIIAPLDLLSKSAIEMGKNEDLSNDNQITRKGNSLFDNAFRDLDRPGVEDTPIDISDIYRNSALGIMEPRMDAEDSDFSDSDEYDHSDEMEDTDQESSTDDEMEIVVPQPFMGNADENSDEDEMMEGDYPVELQIEPQGNVDDSSEPSEEFFEQDPAFFDQNGSNGEEEDEEQNDVENESFTESEESGDEEDGDVEEQEFDPANGLGFYPNEGLNNDPIVEWEADSQEDSQEEDEEDADRFHDLMSNRHDEIANITQLVQQRMGFGANIRNQGRVIPPTEFNIMGRPIFAGRNSQSHAILSHPLLVNQDSSRRGGNVPRGMPNLSPMADFEIVDRDEIPIPYLDQLLPITRNSTLGDIGQLAPSLPESEVEQQIRAIHSHTLLFSDESLKQLNLILFGGVAAEIATKYGNHVMNTLLPDAYSTKLEQKKLAEKKVEEERLKKEQEDKEREKAELEKKKEEEEAVAAAASARLEDTSMLNETEEDVPVALEAPVEEQRIVVVVDGNAVDITGSGIDVTFLEALPDDMRLEVINQHLRERNRTTVNRTPPPTGLNAEFLNALPFEIREEVIRQERQENEMRQSSRQRAPGNSQAPVTENKIDTKSISKSKVSAVNRDSIHLVEISGIASLLRLVFLPDSVNNTSLFNLLGNLCENSKSRNEILGLLLSVLSSGGADLASVDDMFSHLTLKTRKKTGASDRDTPIAASVPDLVAQRCLEVLIHLTRTVSVVGKYFLTESEAPLALKVKSKKGKTKLQTSSLVFPVVSLLNFLDQSRFLTNSTVLEQSMRLLSNVLRPLSLIAKKKFLNPDKANKTDLHESFIEEKLAVHGDKPEPQSSKDEKKEKNDIKLPSIPDSSVINAVTVLKDGISSSKSFQYALSTIQYLCSYPHHLNIITTQLLYFVQSLGDLITKELDQLLSDFKADTQPLNIGILEPFIIPTASQTKILRILKTIDYIYSKEGIAQSTIYLSALKDYQEDFKSFEKLKSPITDTLILEKLYEKLKLGKLWQKLSDVMLVVDENEKFIHVAMTLLPLIEAYMVVSKPSVSLRKKAHSSTINAGLPHVFIKQQSDYSEMENDSFLAFADSNKKLLNTMVRNNPSLMNGSFSLLVQNPKILEFDNKRTYFTQQLHKADSERRTHQNIQINVRRQYVFEESYQQLQGRSGDAIKYGKLNVRFRDEEGVDAGGVTREWFSALALQMFNPDYALFRPSAADKVTYQPNRASGINPDHLFYFKFVGRIIGKAIFDGRLLDAYFTRSFYKCMISAPVDHKDMEAIDPGYYKSLDWILNNDITDVLDLTFSMELDDFGRQKVIDLKPDGRNIAVTEPNKIEYVRLVTEQRLVVAINEQIEAFLGGFHEIIPRDLVKIFNEQELELLISGMPDIDIDDWKNNTDYQNYSQSSPQIQWFWRAVRSFSQEERAKLIQFATGTSKVPLGGFAQLQGSSGIQKFQIHKEFSSTTRLPSAHTCFNQVDLPQYESYEQLRSCLLLAISESEGFGFA